MTASTLPKIDGKVVRRSGLLSANPPASDSGDESDYLDSDEPRKKRRVRQGIAEEESSDEESSDESDSEESKESEEEEEEEEEDEEKVAAQLLPKVAHVPSTFNAPSRVRSRVPTDDKTAATAAAQKKAIDEAVRTIAAGDANGTAPEVPAADAAANVLAAPTDPNTTFDAISVKPWLVRSLSNMAIRRPTAIQKGCIPAILRGHDCIGGSRTGSGKTVAFAVPILQAWSADPSAIFALVLTPTRELALQIYEQFMAISAPQPLKALLVTGGADMRPQAIALAKNPHIVIATPGRLADHIRTSGDDTVGGLKRARYVVLDEADRLLTAAPTLPDAASRGGGGKKSKNKSDGAASGSMLPDVETCLSALPPPTKRQTLLFTATVTPEVRALKTMPRSADRLPVFVCEVETHAPAIPATLTQCHLTVPVTHREHYLHAFLSTAHNAALPAVIVFVNRTSTAAYLHHLLRLLGHRVTALHATLPQRQRTDNLGRFRAAAARILVATDVAARGLDIPEVALVVNYDVPRLPDDYIHRVGRTARAGRRGEAVTFVGQRDVDLVLAIEARVGRPLEAWSEEGVNLETRVTKEALKLVGEKKREALLEIEENREVGGKRKRGMLKLRAT
ncbi:ATP-dependent RNA helicase DDX49/DBP8 [Sporothrix schenckii 1099-18]|uniref:ATP-dependent RNA helicase DDX49/DBP8 n=1 Tax=Sporothrix schenckii 1099-18 TaxID=1397361 RepID=A0A0F2MBY5_SPOSC|nr:ATP-dependent RNA helicase DDX49/DBP8 [Sporothrix schenckii 1099-18]KJR85671.1 ATP-dependent RNA helicase DDX49/DBP8 [Sporothrix schenckii 1099-18]